MEPPNGTLLTFYETSPGYAKPIRSWFYPGRINGLEFLYPKEKIADIHAHLIGTESAAVETAQVETQSTVPQNTAESAIAQNTEPEVQQEQPKATLRATPPEELEAVAPAREQSNTVTEQNNSVATELSGTAGELPLLGALGVAALGLRRSLRA